MGPVKLFDFFGLADILSGILLFFTVSPVPTGLAQLHAGFLVFKGVMSYQKTVPLPTPVYYLGGFADLFSAAILFFGTPPVLAEYSTYFAGLLFFKAVWTSFGAM
ncbi:MAG: hypothetical protein ABEJ95_07035 [Candidatus Nanohalobium sp.]